MLDIRLFCGLMKTSNKKIKMVGRNIPLFLGVDIGGTKCAVVLGDSRAKVLDRIAFPTQTQLGLRSTRSRLFQAVDDLLKKNSADPSQLRRIGISCGGPLDSRRGLILGPSNLLGWDRVPIVRWFQKKYRRPTRLENDANAGALAEWKFGAGRGFQNVIFLTFGTGLGTGLILDGRLYRGTNDMAGEAGHVRLEPTGPLGYGKKGSFEGFCSGAGIARMAQEHFGRALTAKEVLEAARKGNLQARRVLSKSGRYLGIGLSILIDVLNPEVIVIGGIYARGERFFRKEAMKVIRQEALTRSRSVCRIVPSALGERIGDIASLCVALEEGTEQK
jgi:glucokinase